MSHKLYDQMLAMNPQHWCWSCGRGPEHKPAWWFAPWIVQRSHLVNKPRIEDRRAVILSCPLCHLGAWGGATYPQWNIKARLTLPHGLWLKRKFDPEFYDR